MPKLKFKMLWQIWFFFHLGSGVLKHSSVLFVFLTSLISDGNASAGWVITFVFVFVYLTSLLMARRLVRQEASWAPYNDARWRLWDKVLSRIYLYLFLYIFVCQFVFVFVCKFVFVFVCEFIFVLYNSGPHIDRLCLHKTINKGHSKPNISHILASGWSPWVQWDP